MAKKNEQIDSVELLKDDIKNNSLKRLYAFFGEEQYLLENYLAQIRKMLIPEGMEAFNHRKLEGKGLNISELAEAVEAYPAFCEYTLTEVDDMDIAALDEGAKTQLHGLLSDIPEYAVVVFRFDTTSFKLDSRSKLDSAIKKLFNIVEFKAQESGMLTRWIISHVRANGHDITPSDAEYFAFYTGGLMSNLNSEINKVCAYCKSKFVTREDIERMVMPELNAAVFNMTDAVLNNNFSSAVKVLAQLYEMHTEPRMILAVTSTTVRQLYFTKLALEERKDSDYVVAALGLRSGFQARKLLQGARNKSAQWCEVALSACIEAAYKMNTTSGAEDKDILTDLLLGMAV